MEAWALVMLVLTLIGANGAPIEPAIRANKRKREAGRWCAATVGLIRS